MAGLSDQELDRSTAPPARSPGQTAFGRFQWEHPESATRPLPPLCALLHSASRLFLVAGLSAGAAIFVSQPSVAEPQDAHPEVDLLTEEDDVITGGAEIVDPTAADEADTDSAGEDAAEPIDEPDVSSEEDDLDEPATETSEDEESEDPAGLS